MRGDRLLRAALSHMDRGDQLPLVFSGLSPNEAENLFDRVRSRRPGLLEMNLRPGIRSGLQCLFGSGGSRDAFHFSWAVFLVSLGIRGRANGMEEAAGLHQHREAVEAFVLSGTVAGDTFGSLCRVLNAVARFVPSVLFAADLEAADPLTIRLVGALSDMDNLCCPVIIGATAGGSPPFRAKLVKALLSGSAADHEPGPELLGLVRAAAVLGYLFDPGEAAQLAQCCLDTSPLFRSRLWVPTGGSICRFRDPSTRNRFLASLQQGESTSLHLRAAALVKARAAGSPDALRLAGDLFLRGGDQASAGAAYLEAAEASGRCTHAKSARLWALAESHCPEALPRITMERCRRLFLGGFMEQALEAAGKAVPYAGIPARFLMLAILLHMGDDRKAGLVAEGLESCRSEGQLSPQQETDLDMLSLAVFRRNISPEEFIALAADMEKRGLTPVQACRLVLMKARVFARNARFDSAFTALDEAMGMAVRYGFDWLVESCRICRVSCLRKSGRIEEAHEGCRLLEQSASRSGNLEALAYALNTRGGIASSRCDYLEAARCYRNVQRVAERVGNRRLANTAAVNLGVSVMMRGGYDQALELFMKAARMVSESEDPLRLAAVYGNIARIFLDQNRADNAEDCVETMLELTRQSGPAHLLESALHLRARVLDAQGRCEEALEVMDRAAGMAAKAQRIRHHSLYSLYRGLFLMNGGRFKEASEVFLNTARECDELRQSPNAEAARIYRTACQAILGLEKPEALLAHCSSSPSRSVAGTAGYWHWKLTGDDGSARIALENLTPASGENNAYRAHQMLHEIRDFLGD